MTLALAAFLGSSSSVILLPILVSRYYIYIFVYTYIYIYILPHTKRELIKSVSENFEKYRQVWFNLPNITKGDLLENLVLVSALFCCWFSVMWHHFSSLSIIFNIFRQKAIFDILYLTHRLNNIVSSSWQNLEHNICLIKCM